jgi:tetratricopeptide (TPR) repeat protein
VQQPEQLDQLLPDARVLPEQRGRLVERRVRRTDEPAQGRHQHPRQPLRPRRQRCRVGWAFRFQQPRAAIEPQRVVDVQQPPDALSQAGLLRAGLPLGEPCFLHEIGPAPAVRVQVLELEPGALTARDLLGVGLLHTAKDDEAKRKALDTLLSAEKLFAEEATQSTDPLTPRWGSVSCRTFIGVAYKMLGRNAEAIDYFNRALAEHPSDHIARQELAAITTKEEAKP